MSGPIERIVVPLDAASENRPAIETAARLAARIKAPLHGVFVEDEDLLHLANLPFARQFTLDSGAEPLTREHVELHLQAAAERARKELAAAARRHRVEVSFDVARGAMETVLADASPGDLIVAGVKTRPIGAHFRVEHRWCSSLMALSGPIFATQRADRPEGSSILLLGERSAAVARLLEINVAPVEPTPLGELISTYACEILILT